MRPAYCLMMLALTVSVAFPFTTPAMAHYCEGTAEEGCSADSCEGAEEHSHTEHETTTERNCHTDPRPREGESPRPVVELYRLALLA